MIIPLGLGEGDEETHSLTGWPKDAVHPGCGARAALLVATGPKATYECRGTSEDPRSAYGPDRCGKVFEVERPQMQKEN